MKTNKIWMTLLIVILFTNNLLASGTKTGLYLTREDYLAHKLSYESDGTNGNEIKLHALFGSYQVVVITNGKKQYLSKDKVFGYRLNGQDYRYFDHCAYRIIDTVGFYTYGYYKLAQDGKGQKPVEQYYFSLKPDGNINVLTMSNLQAAFKNDTRFLYTVKGFFRSDDELMGYDANLKQYKIKYLYAEAAK
jgi:hypothetical protein